MTFDTNRGPCLPECQNRVLSVAQNSDGSLLCVKTCVDLALYQTALSKAEKIGLPHNRSCAICREPSVDMYCSRCRDRVQRDIQARLNPTKLQPKNSVPKTHSGNSRTRATDYAGYRWITKQGNKSGSCQRCRKKIKPGQPIMAKNMSKVRGNYRYICIDCWDEIQDARRTAA